MGDFKEYSIAPNPSSDLPGGFTYVEVMNSRAKQEAMEVTAEIMTSEELAMGSSELFPKNAMKALSANEMQNTSSNTSWDTAISDVSKATTSIRQGFNHSGSSDGRYKNAIGKTISANGYAAEGAMGVFHNISCGDGLTGYDTKLQELARALDLQFDKFSPENVCGRKNFKNPVEGFIKSIKRLESGLEELINLPGKMLNDLINKCNSVIGGLGLPDSLNRCLNTKVLNKLKVGHIKSPVSLSKKLTNLYQNFDICKNVKDAGISNSESDVISKAAASPIVESAVEFDEKTMLSFATALINSPELNNNVLSESIKDLIGTKPSKYVVNMLIFLAFIKASKDKSKTELTGDIGIINSNLNNNPNSNNVIVDTILNANENGEKLDALDIAATGLVKDSTNEVTETYIKAEDILTCMSDDYSNTTDPNSDYEKIMRLIAIADGRFNPDSIIYKLFPNVTISTLCKMIFESRSKFVDMVDEIGRVQYDGKPVDIVFKRVEDNFDVKDKVAILNALNVDKCLETA